MTPPPPPPLPARFWEAPVGRSPGHEADWVSSGSPLLITPFSLHKRSSSRRVEDGLARARAAIHEAVRSKNYSSYKKQIYVPTGVVYRNAVAFHQSYIEMEKRFEVWVYREGEESLVHTAPLHEIYGIEGQFIDEMVRGKSYFAAHHPNQAHAFFIPGSITQIISYVCKPYTFDRDELQRLIKDYVLVVADRYPYWNGSNGADHFLISAIQTLLRIQDHT